jgi:ABC-type ATPase with predicted acetyltransferase domain
LKGEIMAVWKCNACGFEKESRCKPRKCECGAKDSFEKKE